MSTSGPSVKDAIFECEQKIAELEDGRWPWLMEAVRQGVVQNKLQYQGVQYSAEISIAIEQDYLSVLQSILAAAEMHSATPNPEAQGEPRADAPNAEDFDLGDQGQSGG